jgi:F0F1-type ATP synthase assembly protein I
MITMQGLGLDYGSIWSTTKSVGTDILKSLPGAVTASVEKTVTEKVTPIAQQMVEAKTQSVIKKGNVALFLVGGVTLGALLAGGSWQRRAVGGAILGATATAVGWQIGWLTDKMA